MKKLIFVLLMLGTASCDRGGDAPYKVECKNFVKKDDGWHGVTDDAKIVSVQGNNANIFGRSLIAPGRVNVNGYDVYNMLEKKCGAPKQ